MAVLDASALAAIYLSRDAHHEAVTRWMRDSSSPIHIPALAIAEVAAALARAASGGGTLVDAAVADILSEPRLELHPVGRSLARAAADVARHHRVKGCDAIYVALAQELDDVLVTFDLEQFERASDVVRVLWPT